MVDFEYYLNNDWFKIGRFGEKHVKYINTALLAIGGIFLFSIIFYLIMYSSTNFYKLDDLSDYVQEYDHVENAEFERINLAMKIMPSYNTEKNALYMEHSTDIYKSSIPDSIQIMENFKMNNTFFFINKTALFFPKLIYKNENIPVGDSINMCLAVSWAPKERGNNYDIMKSVSKFPRCKETETGKFIWNSDDPDYGIDVPVWKQKSIEIDCTDDENCENSCKSYNALYVKGRNTKKCYSYDVLETICILIDYDSATSDYFFAGGCFKDNQHYLMRPAEINKEYNFDGIEIEVRNKKDPIIKAGEFSNFTFNFGENWNFLAVFLNILLFLSFIALGVIAFLIYNYRLKYNNSSLLAENNNVSDNPANKENDHPADSSANINNANVA